jgi:FG-GAP-like repeat
MTTRSHLPPASRLVRVMLAVAAVTLLARCGGASATIPTSSSNSGLRATDEAAQAGIAQTTVTHGENCIADINHDGIRDLLLSGHNEEWRLYLGRADGRFVQDHAVSFVGRDRHGCAVADYNGDGRLDIYFSIGADRGTLLPTKELWMQRRDHTFVNRAAAWRVTDPPARGRVPVAFDANGDGRPDLFTGAEVGVVYPSFNRLWINEGDHFEMQEDDALNNELGNFCAAAADIDGDELDEVAVCTPKEFLLYRNLGGRFAEDTKGFGMSKDAVRTAEFADLNGDGRPDLVIVQGPKVQMYLDERGHYEAAFTQPVNDGRDVAFGDVDGDGDLDVYVQQGSHTDADDVLLLNRGDGRAFALGPKLPQPREGAGDMVIGMPDWRGTGRAAFIVNNGYQEHAGPRQLIVFTPTN